MCLETTEEYAGFTTVSVHSIYRKTFDDVVCVISKNPFALHVVAMSNIDVFKTEVALLPPCNDVFLADVQTAIIYALALVRQTLYRCSPCLTGGQIRRGSNDIGPNWAKQESYSDKLSYPLLPAYHRS